MNGGSQVSNWSEPFPGVQLQNMPLLMTWVPGVPLPKGRCCPSSLGSCTNLGNVSSRDLGTVKLGSLEPRPAPLGQSPNYGLNMGTWPTPSRGMILPGFPAKYFRREFMLEGIGEGIYCHRIFPTNSSLVPFADDGLFL